MLVVVFSEPLHALRAFPETSNLHSDAAAGHIRVAAVAYTHTGAQGTKAATSTFHSFCHLLSVYSRL